MDTFYRANVKLMVSQGPGVVPSTLKVPAGDIFSLDGTEEINVERLIAAGAITLAPQPPSGAVLREHAPERPRRSRK